MVKRPKSGTKNPITNVIFPFFAIFRKKKFFLKFLKKF